MKKHNLLFDTLYNDKTTMELDIQLALLYGTDSMQLDIIVPRLQMQKGMIDCGLFALAIATCTLASGIDTVSQSWIQEDMITHCMQCFELFPAKIRGLRSGKLPNPHVFAIDLICDCHPEYAYDVSGENTDQRVVQCDK